MGGHSYAIPLIATDELRSLHSAVPAPRRSFWNRWRAPQSAVQVTEMPRGDRLITYSRPELQAALVADLRGWIAFRFPEPSEATRIVLENYLAVIDPDVIVRGYARPGEPPSEFLVLIGFSGCAGVAEVSARVVGHWTARWYAQEHVRMAEQHFRPANLQPAPHAPDRVPELSYLFVPAGNLGYLEYEPPGESDGPDGRVEIDVSMIEAYEGDPRLDRLRDLAAPLIAGGRCLCQLCTP